MVRGTRPRSPSYNKAPVPHPGAAEPTNVDASPRPPSPTPPTPGPPNAISDDLLVDMFEQARRLISEEAGRNPRGLGMRSPTELPGHLVLGMPRYLSFQADSTPPRGRRQSYGHGSSSQRRD